MNKKMYHVEWFVDGSMDTFQETALFTDDQFKMLCKRLDALEQDGKVLTWKVYEISSLCDYDDIVESLDECLGCEVAQ